MSEKYDYILKWTQNSTKAEHHIPEIEEFARTRSLILHFMESEGDSDEQISEDSQY